LIYMRVWLPYGNRVRHNFNIFLRLQGKAKKKFQTKFSKIDYINSWVHIFKLRKNVWLYRRTVFSCFTHKREGEPYGNRIRLNLINFLRVEGNDKKKFSKEKHKNSANKQLGKYN